MVDRLYNEACSSLTVQHERVRVHGPLYVIEGVHSNILHVSMTARQGDRKDSPPKRAIGCHNRVEIGCDYIALYRFHIHSVLAVVSPSGCSEFGKV